MATKSSISSMYHTSDRNRIFYILLSWFALIASLGQTTPNTAYLLGAALVFFMLSADRLMLACRQQEEYLVWQGLLILALGVGYFAWFEVIQFGGGRSMFIVLGLALMAAMMGRFSSQRPALDILSRPLMQVALTLPAVVVGLALYHHFQHTNTVWLGKNSLALLLAAATYFWYGLEQQRLAFVIAAAGIANLALIFLLRELVWSDPQFYMVPIGATILALTHALRRQMPTKAINPSYYFGALVILVSPIFHIAGGSWWHLFSLMVGSVAVILLAISLQVRVLLYTGTGFLLADLVAMVARGSIDHPDLLWFAGLALGAAIVTLGALAEHNRERLLQQLRAISATPRGWENPSS